MWSKIGESEILHPDNTRKNENGIILRVATLIDRSVDSPGTTNNADNHAKIEATQITTKAILKSRTKPSLLGRLKTTKVKASTKIKTNVDVITKAEGDTKSEEIKRNTSDHSAEVKFKTTFLSSIVAIIVGALDTTSIT